jgi:Toprim domain
MFDLKELARLLDGDVSGSQVVAPGPGHSRKDRSLSVRLSPSAPDGFIVFSHADDDWRVCRDFVRERSGLPREDRQRRPSETRIRRPQTRPEDDGRHRVLTLWRRRQPIMGSVAERYLREARGYAGPIPATLGFLPPWGEHPPAMIAALGLATEPEPGIIEIADAEIRAVHLVRLEPDGRSRLDKITVGRGGLGSPIVVAPLNDGLGLAITEGIEDALSIHIATGLGAWAAAGASRMPAIAEAVPTYCECVTVIGDDNDAGRKNAGELAARLKARCIPVVVKVIGGGLVEAA